MLEWFSIDTRIRDQGNKCIVYHFGRTIEDESLIVQDESFKPYIILTSPFNDMPYDKQRERLLVLWNEHKKTSIYFKEEEYTRLKKKIPCIKISFESVEDYFFGKKIIAESPDKFLELFSKATLKKKYYLERGIIPLTIWSCDATAFPMNSRVKAYQTNRIEQLDSMTYSNPKVMSLTFQTNTILSSFIYDEEPLRSCTYSIESGSRTITWSKNVNTQNKASFVESEIDLIDRTKRSISAERPTIIAGYSSDELIFPRLIARSENYSKNQPAARLNISDDYSIPYASKLGIAINGFVHIDTKTTAENLSILDEYSDLKTILEQNHLNAGGGLLSPETQIEKEQNYAKLVRDAAQTMYPFLAELSKLLQESLFDVSRFNSARSFQSYYETKCLKNKIYPEELILDNEPYTFPGLGIEEWFDEVSLRANKVLHFPHLSAEISISNNISKETFNCKCCKPSENNVRSWYCQKNQAYMTELLLNLISDYDRFKEHQTRINAHSTAPISAKVACSTFLLQGYERSMQQRSNPLYFHQGIDDIARKIKIVTSEIVNEKLPIVLRHEKKLYFDTLSDIDIEKIRAIIRKELNGNSLMHIKSIIGSIIVSDERSGIIGAILTNDHEVKYFGNLKESTGICKHAQRTRDIIVQKIIESKSNEETKATILSRLISLYESNYDPVELIIFTTLYQPLDKYERETLFVKAGRLLKQKGYEVGARIRIPYLVVKGESENDVVVPFINEDLENADISLDYYSKKQLLRATIPFLKSVHISFDDLRIIDESARVKGNK